MKYRIDVLSRASDDTDSIYRWIAERSPQGARHWHDAFLLAAASLADSPERHPIAPELLTWTEKIRELYFKTRSGRRYRILFFIDANAVRILRVRGPGQAQLAPSDLV